jgi:sirohydrochlorin cobaltochelatase
VVVLPYYLFTGTLMQRIHRQVDHLRAAVPADALCLGTHFGFEKEIFDLLEQRVPTCWPACPTASCPATAASTASSHDTHMGHAHAPATPTCMCTHAPVHVQHMRTRVQAA